MQKSAMTSIMEYEKLCRAVEARLHREMHTPADFDYLSDQLQKKTGSSVSSTTLMRLWGYRPSVMVRMSTLDILARFIGYEDYTSCRGRDDGEKKALPCSLGMGDGSGCCGVGRSRRSPV